MNQSIPEKFQRRLTFEYLDPILPSTSPIGHILGGQPASGKSSLIERLKLIYKYTFVTINGDELRRFHPRYRGFNFTDERQAADITQEFANTLAQWLQQKCIESKRSFVIEGTMRKAATPIATANLLNENKFQSVAHIIAVPFEISLLRSYNRYFSGKEFSGQGRFANLDTQIEAFVNLAQTADQLLPHIDTMHIYSGSGYGIIGTFNKKSTQAPSEVIRGQQNSLSPQQVKEIVLQWAVIVNKMKEYKITDPLPMQQIERLLNENRMINPDYQTIEKEVKGILKKS